MRTYRNSLEKMISNRGLYRVWLETREGDATRLVSLWIDPAMRSFESQDAPRETKITAAPLLFSHDEPPSWGHAKDPSWFAFA